MLLLAINSFELCSEDGFMAAPCFGCRSLAVVHDHHTGVFELTANACGKRIEKSEPVGAFGILVYSDEITINLFSFSAVHPDDLITRGSHGDPSFIQKYALR